MVESQASTSRSRHDVLAWARERLAGAGRENPRRVAEWLLADVLGCRREDLFVRPEREVPDDAVRRFRAMVERCADGEPMQHVLGYDAFYGLRLEVSPDVLVPRPETEELVERTLDLVAERVAPRVLDVGTGSGCIALALKHERPDATVHACDVSPDALSVARANAQRLDLDVVFHEADLFAPDFAVRMPDSLDVLVSNPPYIPNAEADALPATVREYDPPVALFARDDPLAFYRALAEAAPCLCVPGGLLIVETHADYAESVGDVFRESGLREVHVERDLSGRPRIAWGRTPDRYRA